MAWITEFAECKLINANEISYISHMTTRALIHDLREALLSMAVVNVGSPIIEV